LLGSAQDWAGQNEAREKELGSCSSEWARSKGGGSGLGQERRQGVWLGQQAKTREDRKTFFFFSSFPKSKPFSNEFLNSILYLNKPANTKNNMQQHVCTVMCLTIYLISSYKNDYCSIFSCTHKSINKSLSPSLKHAKFRVLQRATLVKCVIELPSLVGRFLRCPTCGFGG
jgi:hypothetical protein